MSELFGIAVSISLQLAALVAIALVLPGLLRVRNLTLLLRYHQFLLALCVVLPALQIGWRLGERAAPVDSAAAPAVRFAMLVTASSTVNGFGEAAGFILVAIVALLLVRFLLGLWALRRMRRVAVEWRHWRQALGPATPPRCERVEVLLSDDVTTPATFGWRRRVVLLPRSLPDLDPPTRRAVLIHELIHAANGHWMQLLLERCVAILYWFHPAVLMLSRRVNLLREQWTDRRTVDLTADRRGYLRALLALARLSSAPAVAPFATPPTTVTFLEGGGLRRRIETLLMEVDPMTRIHPLKVTVLAVLLAASVAAAVAVMPVEAPAPVGAQIAVVSQENGAQGANGEDPVSVTENVEKPRKIFDVPPEYTDEARNDKVEGSVILRTVIDKQGHVEISEVLVGLSHGLSEAAVEAVEQWRFEPARKDGEPVSVYFNVTINFRLE